MDNSTKHIPFAVIVAATIGDEAAIQKILDFYDGRSFSPFPYAPLVNL